MPSRNAPEWFGGGGGGSSKGGTMKSKGMHTSTSAKIGTSSGSKSKGKRSHRRSKSLDASVLSMSGHSLDISNHSTHSNGDSNSNTNNNSNRNSNSNSGSRKRSSSSRKKHRRGKSREVMDLSVSNSGHSNTGSATSEHSGRSRGGNGNGIGNGTDEPPSRQQQQRSSLRGGPNAKNAKNNEPLSQQPQKVNDSTPTATAASTTTTNQKMERKPSFVERWFGFKPSSSSSSSHKSESAPSASASAMSNDNFASEEQRLLPDKENKNTNINNTPDGASANVNEHDVYFNEHHHRHEHQISTDGHGHGYGRSQLTTQHGDASMRIPQEPFHDNPLQYQHHPHPHQQQYHHQQQQEQPQPQRHPYYHHHHRKNHDHHGMDQNVYRNHKQPISSEGPYIEHSATYPPQTTNTYDHSSAAGTDSDDLFMYSEDESMTATTSTITPMPGHGHGHGHTSYPMQYGYGMDVNPFPYGTYSYEGYKNRESFEVREHQQMMALAPTNHHITSFAPASIGASASANTSTSTGADAHIGESKYGSICDRKNDLYISEDETLVSESSKFNYRRSSLSSMEGLGGYTSGYASSVYGSSTNMVIEEGDEDEEDEAEAKTNDSQAAMAMTMTSNLINPPPSDHFRHREEPTCTASSAAAAATAATAANKLSRTYSDGTDANTSNSGSGGSGSSKARSVTIKTVPSNYSSESSAGSGKRARRHQKQYSPTPKRQSPPPPMSSVKVHKIHNRNFSSETSTTASTSVPSPMKTVHSSKLTRKEYKRLMKKLETAELREDRVQQIIRSGHEDALEWSMHVPQNIRGISRAAGFFPEAEIKLHDFPFAILFLVQVGVVISMAISYANETVMGESSTSSSGMGYEEPFGINTYSDDPFGAPMENWAKDIHVDYKNAFQLACITALYATSLSALSIGMMMILGKALIPTVLCLKVIICIGFATIGSVLTPYSCIPIVGLLALILSLGYSVVVWERIPFASTNLNTALCGVKSCADMLLVAFVMMMLSFLWTIGWFIASLGVYDHYLDKNSESGVNNSITWSGICIYVGMCISYFWTINVMNNIVHVTIAGVVATWWADPDSLSTCCSSVLLDLFSKSMTTSFGSICLGSLVVPPLDFLKTASSFCCDSYTTSHRRNHDAAADLSGHGKLGDCVSEASSPIANLPIPTSPLDGIIRYFNDYGFTYVGIYREGFSTSSRKATDVFKAREWVGVSSDRLVPNILGMISVIITLGSGCFGLVVEEFDGYNFTNFQKPTSTAFFIGCWIGFVISRILFKVVGSAVNTVLVCFSLAPWTFKVNHPVLSHEMRSSWGGTWLDEHEWINSIERGEAIAR